MIADPSHRSLATMVSMAKQDETSLYPPVKGFLEEAGFEVKGEVRGCDVVGVRGEDVVVAELKLRMSLSLVLQGVDRLKMTDLVYLAIAGPRKADMGRWSETVALCRRLGLGLLVVHLRAPGGPRVDVVADPEPYKPRQVKARRDRLLGEFRHRSGDHNPGGANRRKLVTAYREQALLLAAELRSCGPSGPAGLRKATGCEKAGPILRDNYYGWFIREERGIYALTPAGEEALTAYSEVLVGMPSGPAAATSREGKADLPKRARAGYHPR